MKVLRPFWNDLFLQIKNIPGKRTTRKIIVFECDDWGCIRVPSKEILILLNEKNIPIVRNRFTEFDTLEDKKDLERLFGILTNTTDFKGNNAVFTAVTCVENPDFVKIRESGFREFYGELFPDTLMKNNRHPDTFKVWKDGINKGIFIPQLHGRTHIPVMYWMRSLHAKDQIAMSAFDYGFTSVITEGINENLLGFRKEFFFEKKDDIPELKKSISKGIQSFKSIFGISPSAFIPPNGIFHPFLEDNLSEEGVKYLYSPILSPIPDLKGGVKQRLTLPGFKNRTRLYYYNRNCVFEPTDKNYRGIDYTIHQIKAAFKMQKPAFISTHRVNFVGGIDPANSKIGLSELDKLIRSIIKIWPEVEFMSSSEALDSIIKTKQ